MRNKRRTGKLVAGVAIFLLGGGLAVVSMILSSKISPATNQDSSSVSPAPAFMPATSSTHETAAREDASSRVPSGNGSEAQLGEIPIAFHDLIDELRKAAELFGLSLRQRIIQDTTEQLGPYMLGMRQVIMEDRSKLTFSARDGVLQSYSVGTLPEVPLDLNIDSALSKGRALGVVAELLQKTPSVHMRGDLEAHLLDMSRRRDGDLEGSNWIVSARYELDGIPYLESGTRVVVSGYDGSILSWSNKEPPPPPSSTVASLDSVRAVDSIQRFLMNKQKELSPSNLTIDEPVKVIVRPNNMFDLLENEQLQVTDTARVCWVANVLVTGNSYPLMCFVDAQTGEIVGGMQ